MAVAIQHINSIPLSPREIDAEIPEALEAITMKAMASDVNQRYISADAMLADLEEFRKNPSINFDYTSADLLVTEGDEPTQILGANTPHAVRAQPAHSPRAQEDTFVHPAPHPRKSRPARGEEDYDDYPEPGSGSRLPIILAIVAVVVFVAGIGVFLWISFFGGTRETMFSVPSLSDMTVEEAREDARVVSAQFQIVEGGSVDSDRAPGVIVSQDPQDGRNALSGASITVMVSNGSGYTDAENRVMPPLEDEDWRVAASQLGELGFSEEAGNLTIEREHSDYTEGRVIRTDPAAGADLTDVAAVVLVVSDGPDTPQVTVIPFLSMTEEEARQKAVDLGLTPVFDEPQYSDYPAGTVCWQSIESGLGVPEGTTIRFRLSLGPDPEAVPSEEPSPEPTPTPAPTPGSELRPYTLYVDLPRDKETVQVTVSVSDGYTYTNYYDTVMQRIPLTVYGSGVQEITVTIDGEVTHTESHDFG